MNSNSAAWSFLGEWIVDNHIVNSRIRVLMPEPCIELFSLLAQFSLDAVEVVQTFKPHVEEFRSRGFVVACQASDAAIDYVFMVPTRQRIESLGWIAAALQKLGPNEQLIFCCANAHGAAGFVSHLKELAPVIEVESARKCKRVVLSRDQVARPELLEQWIAAAGAQVIADTTFHTVPGIFGWNKIDRGSELLLSTLPVLSGMGADLGSGYGFLSQEVLKKNAGIAKLFLLEAEARALECARKNLKNWEAKAEFIWSDITHDPIVSLTAPCDFVIMNPPFHESTQAEPEIGRIFIRKAAELLKTGGKLYLVANRFLPYEDTLAKFFKKSQRVLDNEGFKVLHAQK